MEIDLIEAVECPACLTGGHLGRVAMSNTTRLSNHSLVTDIPIATRLVLGLALSSALNIFVVGGNLLTLFCFVINRHLRRNRTNYFVGSLALADFALGLFVLPPFIVAEWTERWPFGNISCRVWILVDIWLYTSSIYSVIAIAVDRYWAITRPLKHKSLTTHGRAVSMIIWSWSLSFAIALPSLFFEAPLSRGQCSLVLHSSIYIIYSSIGSFYLPMAVLLYLYINIYRTIRKVKLNGTVGLVRTMDISPSSFLRSISEHPDFNGTFKKRRGSDDTTVSMSTGTMDSFKRQQNTNQGLRVHRGRYHRPISNHSSFTPPLSPITPIDQGVDVESNPLLHKSTFHHPHGHLRLYETVGHFLATKHVTARNCRNKLLMEFKAVRMVAMITASFFLCWTGFCILCTMNAFADQFNESDEGNGSGRDRTMAPGWLIDSVTWLGYLNSAVDPLIYAVSNQRFKKTFKRVLKLEFPCYWS